MKFNISLNLNENVTQKIENLEEKKKIKKQPK